MHLVAQYLVELTRDFGADAVNAVKTSHGYLLPAAHAAGNSRDAAREDDGKRCGVLHRWKKCGKVSHKAAATLPRCPQGRVCGWVSGLVPPARHCCPADGLRKVFPICAEGLRVQGCFTRGMGNGSLRTGREARGHPARRAGQPSPYFISLGASLRGGFPVYGKGLCRQGHQWGNACVARGAKPAKDAPRTLHLHALPACGWDAGNSPICGGQPAPFPRHAAFAHSLSHTARLQRAGNGVDDGKRTKLRCTLRARDGASDGFQALRKPCHRQEADGGSSVRAEEAVYRCPMPFPAHCGKRLFPREGRTHAPPAVEKLCKACGQRPWHCRFC